MAWLDSYYIWVLLVITQGGMTSQQGIYTTEHECDRARQHYEQTAPPALRLRAECRQRVRTLYQ